MGAGASISDDETVRVTNLITAISGDKNDGRLSALQELSKLCDLDEYKMPLIERGKLLPALVKILSETGDISDDQIEVAKCCWYLSRRFFAVQPVVSEKNMVSSLVSFIQRSQGNARGAALACFSNCAILPLAVEYLLNFRIGLLDIIAMVITTDTSENNVKMAYAFLANISIASWPHSRFS